MMNVSITHISNQICNLTFRAAFNQISDAGYENNFL